MKLTVHPFLCLALLTSSLLTPIADAADAAQQRFIKTLNDLRAMRGLPAMRLDAQINQSAQWLADHMGRHDVMDHDAVVIGGKDFTNMRELGDRLKHFGFKDNGAAEACAEGEFDDESTAAREFTLGWVNGKTHYRPFLSKDGQVFETCGFGLARSKKDPKKFYACALFADRDPAQPAPAVASGGKPKMDKYGNVIPDGAPPPGLEKPIDMPADAKGPRVPQGRKIAADILAAIAVLLNDAKPAPAGTAVGGIALKFAPGWTTVMKGDVITSVNPDGTARVVITPVAGPKDAPDGPWDAIQENMAKRLAPHFPGLGDLEETNTEHDVIRDGVGLRVVTYTATFQGVPVNIIVDFARENNVDGDRLVLIIRCSEQGDAKNEAAARNVAESMRLKK